MNSLQRRWTHILFTLVLLASSCTVPDGVEAPSASEGTIASQAVEYDIERDPDVPSLPFDDNPDPAQCGIPVQWGESNAAAWLSGDWEGELIQPEVRQPPTGERDG